MDLSLEKESLILEMPKPFIPSPLLTKNRS